MVWSGEKFCEGGEKMQVEREKSVHSLYGRDLPIFSNISVVFCFLLEVQLTGGNKNDSAEALVRKPELKITE